MSRRQTWKDLADNFAIMARRKNSLNRKTGRPKIPHADLKMQRMLRDFCRRMARIGI